MSMNMLADQSFSRSNLHMPEMTTPAFQGEFHSLPLSEEEQLWSLGPISPTMSSWDAKADQQQQQQQQAFAHASLERDLKTAHVRNGQPTPPPFNDLRASNDVYPPLPQYQLGVASPPPFPNQDRHHRSVSEQSAFEDDPPYSPAISSSSNNNNYTHNSNSSTGHGRRNKGRNSAVSKPMGYTGSGRPERAKREKFLERNRLAASKCRQKKKEHTLQLETQFKEQSGKKELLVNEIARLRSEILGLKNEVLRHAQCGDEPIKLHLAQMVKKITYNENSGAPEMSDAADAVSTSEDASSPVGQHSNLQHHHPQGMVSFGFDDALQMDPSASESLQQQMRRQSETSQASQGTYGFSSTDDNFDDLINV